MKLSESNFSFLPFGHQMSTCDMETIGNIQDCTVVHIQDQNGTFKMLDLNSTLQINQTTLQLDRKNNTY